MFLLHWTRRSGIALTALAVGLFLAAGVPRAQQSRRAPAHGLGLIRPKQSDYARYPALKMSLRDAGALPDRFTLEDFLPPIGNQGKTGSCVGWSTAYYCYSMAVAKERRLTSDQRQDSRFLFSPGWIWDQYNGGDPEKGMQIFQAFEVLEKMGCAPLAEYPWKDTAQTWKPTEAAKKKAEFYKARRTLVMFRGARAGDPADPEKMRHWLYEAKLPIVIGIPIYEDFPRGSVPDSYVYSRGPSESPLQGYHAICILGYDKSKQAFMMVNSWGEAWGSRGKMWLSEKFIVENAIQGCVQTPGGPRLRGYQIVPPSN